MFIFYYSAPGPFDGYSLKIFSIKFSRSRMGPLASEMARPLNGVAGRLADRRLTYRRLADRHLADRRLADRHLADRTLYQTDVWPTDVWPTAPISPT